MVNDIPIPESLSWMAAEAKANEWLKRLPDLVGRAARRWDLTVGAPFGGGYASWVAPAEMADGGGVVLKIQFPHRESRYEAEALRRWQGRGAVVLLEHDVADSALLLERATPGQPLSSLDPATAINVLTGLLGELLIDADLGFDTVADEAASWLASLERHVSLWPGALSPRLAAATREFLTEMKSRPDRPMLVNQDLHADNVVNAQRRPWLVIDPKPLIGDAAFAGVAVIRSSELGHSRNEVLDRLDRVVDSLGTDRLQTARYAIAHSVAWGFTPQGPLATHIDTATWLLSIVG